MESKKIKIKNGKAIIDATITETPFRPKGKAVYDVIEEKIEENEEDNNNNVEINRNDIVNSKGEDDDGKVREEKNKSRSVRLIKEYRGGVDKEGGWLKKGEKLYYGFKQAMVVDERGLIDVVYTTRANVNDSKLLPVLLPYIYKEGKEAIYADKGFKTTKNDELLRKMHLKNRIMHKAYRGKKLKYWQKEFNKLVGGYGYVIERTFGSIKRWFNGGVARYKGLAKVHAQRILQAIAYNLKRAVSLI